MHSELESLLKQTGHEHHLIETHISWVLLGPEFVFKFKKPVNFGFLDFTTPEKRKKACEAEVALNSRLTSKVYEGLVPVRKRVTHSEEADLYVDDADFLAEKEGPASQGAETETDPVVDYAVKMRRLHDEDRADNMLAEGRLHKDHIEQLAELLCRFHAGCARGETIARFGLPDAISQNVNQNFEQTEDLIESYLPPNQLADLRTHQLDFLQDNTALFQRRASQGHVRDGHGDLRLEHVYFTKNGIQIIDCIEFNEQFRYADVCADLAFLVMDLRHKGAHNSAERLLALYAERSGDFELYQLIDFYEAYRAFVRGKVMALLEREKVDAGHRDATLHTETRRYFLHAVAAQEQQLRPPRIIAVGGLIASGKSTVSKRIAERLGAPVLEADRCRKRLAGLPPEKSSNEAPFTGLYSPGMSDRVYSQLMATARSITQSGRSVIIDATFRRKHHRDQLFAEAQDEGLSVSLLWCHADRATTMKRLEERKQKTSISDGRAEIYDEIERSAEPPTQDESSSVIAFDTTLSPSEQNKRLEDLLGIEDGSLS